MATSSADKHDSHQHEVGTLLSDRYILNLLMLLTGLLYLLARVWPTSETAKDIKADVLLNCSRCATIHQALRWRREHRIRGASV